MKFTKIFFVFFSVKCEIQNRELEVGRAQLEHGIRRRETTVDPDTFTSGTCGQSSVVISREGGMTIFCTGNKAEMAKLKGQNYPAFLKESKLVKSGKKEDRTEVAVENYTIQETGILFALPALCKYASQQSPGCKPLLEWNSVSLVLTIDDSEDLIVAKNIRPIRVSNRVAFAKIIKLGSDVSTNGRRSFYEIKKGNEIVNANHGIQDELRYMILNLYFTNDIDDILEPAMEYLKDHLVIIFKPTTKRTTASTKFISSKNYKNRERNGTNEIFEKFNSIKVGKKKGPKRDQLYFEIVLPFDSSKYRKTIPWDDVIVLFKIGEIGDSANDYPSPIGEPKEISELKIEASNISTSSIIIGLGALVIIGLIVVGVVVYWKKFRQNDNHILGNTASAKPLLMTAPAVTEPPAEDTPRAKFDEFLEMLDDEETVSDMKYLYIPPRDIQLTKKTLGKGAFGIALVGRYRQKDVCVKTCRIDVDFTSINGSAARYSGNSAGYRKTRAGCSGDTGYNSPEIFRINEDLFKDIFKEAVRMKGFEHQNVMRIIGVSLDQDLSPQIILPLMNKKDLQTFVSSDQNEITYKMAIKFALDAARGMEYLSSNFVIHRDLAARNCLLHEEKGKINLRISDFGLSKHIDHHYGKYDIYEQSTQTKLPMKWLALEVLESRVFTTMSDVWAYGVLVWEILTRGCTPYGSLSGWQEIKTNLEAGNRLHKPVHCDDELYEMMIRCWHDDKKQRPTFSNLVEFLANHYKKIANKEIVTQNEQQLKMPKNQAENDFDIYYNSPTKATYLLSARRGSAMPTSGPNASYAQPRDQV